MNPPFSRRAFLVGLQSDFGERGKTDDVFDGGIDTVEI
jgi:hypothetical protein